MKYVILNTRNIPIAVLDSEAELMGWVWHRTKYFIDDPALDPRDYPFTVYTVCDE